MQFHHSVVSVLFGCVASADVTLRSLVVSLIVAAGLSWQSVGVPVGAAVWAYTCLTFLGSTGTVGTVLGVGGRKLFEQR